MLTSQASGKQPPKKCVWKKEKRENNREERTPTTDLDSQWRRERPMGREDACFPT